MKKILLRLFIPALASLMLCGGAMAQQADERQRTLETIVADGLAQLPAANVATFDQVFGEFAATGSAGVEALAAMLTPALEGKNATFEYALNGLAAYVTAPGREALREGVRKGFVAAIARCKEDANRAFLFTQLQLCSTADEAPVFVSYLTDPYLSDYALRALISTPGTEQTLLDLATPKELAPASKRALAYAFAEKRMTQAEPILLGWLRDADPQTTCALHNALAACGGRNSLKPLAAAAARVNYAWEETVATESYLKLLAKLAASGDSATAAKAAKGLLGCEPAHVRGGALQIYVQAVGAEKAMPAVVDALKKGSAVYRFAALESLGQGDPKSFAQVAGLLPTLEPSAQAAAITWLGERNAASQSEVVAGYVGATDAQVAKAAIAAAGRLGGEKSLAALIAALESSFGSEAMKALQSFQGDLSGEVQRMLASHDARQLVPALRLAAARRMAASAERVFELLDSSDVEVREAAFEALPRVVDGSRADRLAKLLDATDSKHVASVQAALWQSIGKIPAAEQYGAIARYMEASKTSARYYPVLAKTGSSDAVARLSNSFREGDRDAAFAALLTVDTPQMPDVLYAIAAEHPALADQALMRYASLKAVTAAKSNLRYELCCRALELNPSAAVCNKLLTNLSSVRTLPALIYCARYLDKPQCAEAAAGAVKAIVAKSNPMPGGESVRRMLEKSREIYRSLVDADAGYAIDELTELLSKIPASGLDEVATPPFKLSAEEAAQHYEVLFDGSSLDKWTGNKLNYVISEGTIDVTASYGGKGNLYTLKEYGDFTLRFEFRFLNQGVNNGIGIRTPMKVNAAYEGMEVQVLDHDAPIYKNLRVYQQHGSVYGILPAQERVKFGELGQWNTMEIHAVGDRIRVTVNGRVILDGNIREACQGKHIAPDGSKSNPFTVDGKNHPGLFNQRGHIGLLGHGAGIQFRNLRIRDLAPVSKRR